MLRDLERTLTLEGIHSNMTKLRQQIARLRASSWGAIATLRAAHEKLPNLPEQLSAHLTDGSIVLGDPDVAPFGLADFLQWLVSDSLASRAAASFFRGLLTHQESTVRTWAARGLAAFPTEAPGVMRELLASPDASIRELGFSMAGDLFRAPGARAEDARDVLPLMEAGSAKLKGIGKKIAAGAIEIARALAARAPAAAAESAGSKVALPDRPDLDALAASAPADAALQKRLVAALRMGELVAFAELADALGVDESHARAIAAQVVQSWEPRVAKWSARGIYWGSQVFDASAVETLGASPWTIEALALEGRTAELDVLLAPTPRLIVTLRNAGKGAPVLRWASTQKPLSSGAQAFYLACLARPGFGEITRLLTPLADDASLVELALWLLSDPKAHQKERFVLPASPTVVQEIARARAHGIGRRKPWQYEGLPLSVTQRRWAIRWWHEARGDRDATRFALHHGAARVPLVELARWLPTSEEITREAIADGAWWAQRVVDSVELAMHAQSRLPMQRARRAWLRSVASAALRGVVFHVDGQGLAWIDGDQFVSASGSIPSVGDAAVRVAHPLVDTGEWPSEAAIGIARFAQRQAPRWTLADLPAAGSVEAVPLTKWKQRCAQLGYYEPSETGGGTLRAVKETDNGTLEVHHGGYGSGYGGSRPVTFKRAFTSIGSPAAHAALVADMRRLFGLDAMPEPTPAAGQPPAPSDAFAAALKS